MIVVSSSACEASAYPKRAYGETPWLPAADQYGTPSSGPNLNPIGAVRFDLLIDWGGYCDTAPEEGTLADTDAPCNDIPGQRSFTPNVHTVAGIDVAQHLTEDHHLPSADVGTDLCIPGDSDLAIRKANCSFDCAVDE
jgi:hypothetical protein